MNLVMLEYFVVSAEERSFSAAAEKLYVSQPAVTRQVLNLEKELNVTLFDRTRSGLVLTEEGRPIYLQAKTVLADVNRILSEHPQNVQTQRLRIGYSGNLEINALFHVVSAMAEKHPEIDLEFANKNMSVLHDRLRKGVYDIIVCPLTGLYHDSALELLPFIRSPLMLAVSVHHPLAEREKVSLRDLRNEKFITFLRNESHDHSDILIRDCNRAGFSPNIVAEADNTMTYLLMLAANVGCAIVGRDLQAITPCGIAFIPIEEYENSAVYSGAAWLKTNSNSACKKFIRELKLIYPEIASENIDADSFRYDLGAEPQ